MIIFNKLTAQILGIVIVVAIYLIAINYWLISRGSGAIGYAPGTLIVALLGLWLGGYVYDRLKKS